MEGMKTGGPPVKGGKKEKEDTLMKTNGILDIYRQPRPDSRDAEDRPVLHQPYDGQRGSTGSGKKVKKMNSTIVLIAQVLALLVTLSFAAALISAACYTMIY